MIADWEKNQENGETILIHGKTFQDYIATERDNLKFDIENDKKNRVIICKKLTKMGVKKAPTFSLNS